MTRRFDRMYPPRPAWTWGDTAITVLIAVFMLAGCLIAFGAFLTIAHAHDSWISKGSYKNAAGEWCCGDYDCKTYNKASSAPTGWMLDGELVPYDEAMPIAPPDGQVVVCRRPDGSRRCVFGLKPGL